MSLHTNKGLNGQEEYIRAREGEKDTSVGRFVSNGDPLADAKAFARLARAVFGPGVTLHPDRYAYLWEPVEPWRPRGGK